MSKTRLWAVVVVLTPVFGAACGASVVDPITDSCALATGDPISVGFYAFFEPVSYSEDPDPSSPGFAKHLGYEADLLTALEAMEERPVAP